MAGETVAGRYQEALDRFVEKVRQDPYILAAILMGSLSHDVVWEKSDIDMLLVAQEGRDHEGGFSLTECGVIIHASLMPRSKFKRAIEGSLQSSFLHSALNKGRILFTRDETLADLFERGASIGARDREAQLLQNAVGILPALTKAEKWLRAKGDADYCFLWIMKSLDGLARIETILQGEVTGREVIHQALRHHPAFFRAVYTDLIHGDKSPGALDRTLTLIEAYLMERVPVLFKPLLEYLDEAGGPRSARELNHYFQNQMNLEGVDNACEWLADQQVLGRVALPLRLTPKSRVDVDEAAYYYEAG